MSDEAETLEAEEEDDESAYESVSLAVNDGECVILDRDVFIAELDFPLMIRMTGSQLWLYWFKDGEWTYSEIKAKEKGKKAAPPSAIKSVK